MWANENLADLIGRAFYGVGLWPLVGNAGSNSAGSKFVSCECCMLSGRDLCNGADNSSGGVLPIAMCMSTIAEPQQRGGLGQGVLLSQKTGS
jgi:hypothetical protein